MAIIVEEEKKTSNASALLGGLIVIGILVAAGYYIFLATPPAVIATPPPNFAIISPISGINLDPQRVLGNPSFQALKSYVAEPTSTGPGAIGRTDPFLAP